MSLGLLVRRERWTLSLRGRLLALGIVLTLAIAIPWAAFPFLALNHPIDADLLIVEGWISDLALQEAASEFRRGHYRELLVVQSVYDSEAPYEYVPDWISREYRSRILVESGVPSESLGTLYYPAAERDRTYHAALAAKAWIAQRSVPLTSFNVLTVGPHARRSWLLFQKAFGSSTKIGIVAVKDPMYDPLHWWRVSEGVREVLGEAIAYVYARFFLAWN